jgi:hypothetical protein
MTATDARSVTHCRRCDTPIRPAGSGWIDERGWDTCKGADAFHRAAAVCRVVDEILPWADKDGNLNIHEGDLVLDEGAMCAVEGIDIEVLDDDSLCLHVSLRDPRRVNTGLPVYASEFAGGSLTAVRRYITEETP